MPNPNLSKLDKLSRGQLRTIEEVYPEIRLPETNLQSPVVTSPNAPAAPKSNMTKNIIIGVGAVIFIVATIVIIKKLRK